MPTVSDAAWLRARIDAGASVAEIARQVGRTPRTVRNALHRHRVPHPGAARNAAIDVDVVLARYRRGEPVSHIAADIGVSARWITDRVAAHAITRTVPLQHAPRRSRYRELNDPTWLIGQLAERGPKAIARDLGTHASTVNAALRRHGITPPPAGATALERIAWIPDPVVRLEHATRFIAQTKTALGAAYDIQAAATRQIGRGEH